MPRYNVVRVEFMRIPSAYRPQQSDAHLIPLINVVFLLLIFFMMAGTFTTPEPLDVDAPVVMSSGGDVGAEATWVYVGVGDEIAVGQTRVHADDLADTLRTMHGGTGLGRVYIKVDERAAAGRLFDVTAAVRASSPRSIELITRTVGPR